MVLILFICGQPKSFKSDSECRPKTYQGCKVSADAWGLDVPWCLDPLGGALLRPEWVQQKAVRGRMEICGLCPFNFAMA